MKRKNILEFKNNINVWDGEKFVMENCNREKRIEIIQDLNKLPGEMNLDERIFISNQVAEKFKSIDLYTEYTPHTRDWVNFWEEEKQKIYTGLLIDDFYITGSQYWFQNYCPINDKVKNQITFPRIFDTQIWLAQKEELAQLTYKFNALVKARQKGITLWYDSDILKDFWFLEGFAAKICAWDEKYVKENWKILDIIKSHLNENTGWYRGLDPEKQLDWLINTKLADGTSYGSRSSLRGITFKNNAAAVVSGATHKIYIDEGGIAPNADEVLEFIGPALTFGNISTGNFTIAGAVGKLKDAGPLKDMILNPDKYNMLSIGNHFAGKPEEKIGLFIPESWSYGDYIDQYGNSDVEGAVIEINRLAEEAKKKSYKSYMIYKSQRPLTLEDAFAEREENDFPTHLIQPWYNTLEKKYDPIIVELSEDRLGKVTHSFGSKYPLVEEFPVKKSTIKHGAVVIKEMPIPNSPFGLYYAGVDTISPIMTSEAGVSLQCIYIYKSAHEIDGEFSEDKIVAWYTGRPEDRYESFEITKKLIKFYNARSGIENDNKNFIEWMISKRQQKYMMKRDEFPLSKDILKSSTISRAEYGIRTGTKTMKNYLISLVIEYCEEIIGYSFDEEGNETVPIYGVTRIYDKMLLKEMLNYTPKKNVDRIMAFAISLFAARSNTNRGIKIKTKEKTIIKKKTRSRSAFRKPLGSPFIKRF